MYYSYVEIEYVATSFSPARTDLALKLLRPQHIFFCLEIAPSHTLRRGHLSSPILPIANTTDFHLIVVPS